ncbi:MAG TPA: hemolysin D, partial [Pirellulaceae bacterium]|nr:hemolysin D [Pirellulaceae bacterium]
MTRSAANTTFTIDGSTPLVVGTLPDATPDPRLIQDTKEQIRALAAEIEGLATGELSPAEFYAGFLNRVVAALAGVGGAIWTRDTTGNLALAYQVNLPEAGLTDANRAGHLLLIDKVWQATGQPQLVPPRAGSSDAGQASNPTDHLLVLAPLSVEQQTIALVEIFQRPGGGPTTQRGYLRFLTQMCAFGSDYLKNRRLRQYHDRQAMWSQFESFLRAVHRRLDTRHTTFTLANEGRRLTECDRLSVLLYSGRKARVVAVSGLDTIDRRAAEIRALEALASTALAAGEPIWFAGDSSQLAPQIDEALHDFVDISQARAVGIAPLYPAYDREDPRVKRPRPLGAIIVERWEQSRWSEPARERVLAVAEHGGLALANAQEYQSLFLLPLWKALGKAAWMARFRALPKTLLLLL